MGGTQLGSDTRPPSLTLLQALGKALTPLSPSLSDRNVVGHWGLE